MFALLLFMFDTILFMGVGFDLLEETVAFRMHRYAT